MLFARDLKTEKVTFDGGWVELMPLSKGALDEYQSRLTELTSKLKGVSKEQLQAIGNKEINDIPAFMVEVVREIKNLEYFKLSQAIKKWSETEVEITEDSIKELAVNIFDELVDKVNEMNSLTDTQRKN